ncbi:hypothetical protein ACHAQA_009572 [Verticillium albo-atrum]
MARPKRFAEFEEKTVKDYDPEADSAGENEQSGSGSEDEGADLAGTEHYLNVGKSKIRQKENVSLGPQYRGARVSRQALEDSDEGSEDFEDAQEDFDSGDEAYDDPETADLAADEARSADDAEISSDDALGESDDEKLEKFVFRGSSKPVDSKSKGGKKQRPTAADFISGSEDELDPEQDDDSDGSGGVDLMDVEADEESGESGSGDEDEDEEEGDSDLDGFINDDSDLDDDEEEEDDDDEEGSDDDEEKAPKLTKSSRAADARAEQRKLMNEGQKALVATISAATQQDAAKGLAVRQQRKTFDGLLNIRIRLQKAIVATNSFSAFEGGDDDAEPYSAAEEAALKLLGTLDSVRATLVPATSTSSTPEKKRKRDTSTEALWAALQETDARAAKHRRKVLDNWSSKTRNATVEVKARNLVASQQTLVASLEDQLVNSDRLLKRARTPRSCAPLQVAAKVNEDASVYDDADFYQLLLKELVEQRTSDETAAQASGGALATVRWAAMKEARTKKHVDRRASKGRKMRFNIHEKLQNFMAPEDRRGWEQDAVDRLFGTLFGQRMVLAEGAGEPEDEEMAEGAAEEEGLRLFRS